MVTPDFVAASARAQGPSMNNEIRSAGSRMVFSAAFAIEEQQDRVQLDPSNAERDSPRYGRTPFGASLEDVFSYERWLGRGEAQLGADPRERWRRSNDHAGHHVSRGD